MGKEPAKEIELFTEVPVDAEGARILLEQYKLCVEMADRVSARRTASGNLFLSAIAGVSTVFTLLLSTGWIEEVHQTPAIFSFAGVGFGLSAVWALRVSSARQLNSGKFKVINAMEEHLTARCFAKEWDHLARGRSSGIYLRLSLVEQAVPLILCAAFVFIGLVAAR